MSGRNLKKNILPPSEGQNDKQSPLMIKPIQATVLENFEVNERGVLDKSKGYIQDGSPFPNDTDSFIRLLLNYRPSVTSELLLMMALDDGNSNNNYKVDIKKTSGDGSYSYIGHTTGTASFTNGNTAVTGVGTAWSSHLKAGDKIKASAHADGVYAEIQTVNSDTSITLTANYSGATVAGASYIARIISHKDYVPRGVVFNNKAIITNGSEKMMAYNNTTLDLITDTDAPRCRFIEAHKSRLFVAATSGSPSNLYWSATNDETSWNADAFEPIFPQDNGNIVGIVSFADSLIVFKNNGNIYQVVGNFDEDDDGIGYPSFIRRIDTNENIGAIPEGGIRKHMDGFLYFLADTGCYRIDSRLFVEKVSEQLDTFFDNLNFALGPTQSKTYTYDTDSQFDSGTHSGTISRSNTLTPYFDLLTITDAYKTPGGCSVYIDSSNNVHVAYILSSDRTKVRYKKWLASSNAVSTDETINFGYNVYGVSLDVSSGGIAGIAVSTFEEVSAGNYTKRILFSQRTGGSWISPETANQSSAGVWSITSIYGVSLRFRSDGLARIAIVAATNANNTGYCRQISAGSWDTVITAGDGNRHIHCSLHLKADNDPRIAASDYSANAVFVYSGSGSESSLSSGGTDGGSVSVTFGSNDYGVQIDKTSANKYLVGFCDGGALKVRNFTDSSSTTLDSDTDNVFLGYQLNSSDQNNAYRTVIPSSDRYEKFTFEGSSHVLNTASTVDPSYSPGDRGFHRNGVVFASIAFGLNANEILVRRLAYRAVWTSPEQSDASLTAWGTYEVADQVNNSATVTHELGTNTASPVSSYSTIVTGQQIGASVSNIYVRHKVTFVLGAFSKPEVGSIIVNYTGSGVDGKQAFGASFDNQLYFFVARNSATANDRCMVFDTEDSWSVRTYPISVACRFKKKLYAGHSGKGDLLILEQGYNFDDAAYEADCQLKEDILDSIELEKDIDKIFVLFEVKPAGSTMTVSYRLDSFVTYGGSTWVSTTIDTSQKGIAEIHVGKSAKSIQLRVQNSTVDHQVGFIGATIIYGYKHLR